MKDEMKVLEMVAETEILGKKIKMYGSVEEPYFVATDVAEWLDERDGYTVARKVDDEDKDTQIVCTLGGMQKTTVFTEDGLYDACMLSRKKIAKPLKKEIKMYLKAIRKTGAAIQPGREEEMVQKYFPSFSPETQADIFAVFLPELLSTGIETVIHTKNATLKQSLRTESGCVSKMKRIKDRLENTTSLWMRCYRRLKQLWLKRSFLIRDLKMMWWKIR